MVVAGGGLYHTIPIYRPSLATQKTEWMKAKISTDYVLLYVCWNSIFNIFPNIYIKPFIVQWKFCCLLLVLLPRNHLKQRAKSNCSDVEYDYILYGCAKFTYEYVRRVCSFNFFFFLFLFFRRFATFVPYTSSSLLLDSAFNSLFLFFVYFISLNIIVLYMYIVFGRSNVSCACGMGERETGALTAWCVFNQQSPHIMHWVNVFLMLYYRCLCYIFTFHRIKYGSKIWLKCFVATLNIHFFFCCWRDGGICLANDEIMEARVNIYQEFERERVLISCWNYSLINTIGSTGLKLCSWAIRTSLWVEYSFFNQTFIPWIWIIPCF